MTVRADFAVDLEAALQLRLVVFAERSRERPGQPRRRRLLFGESRHAQRDSESGGEND